jgi:hypothetical protein
MWRQPWPAGCWCCARPSSPSRPSARWAFAQPALLPDALRGLLLSALCIAGVLAAQHATARFDMPLLSLAAGALAAVVLPALLLILRPQLLGQDASDMVIRFVPGLAKFLHRPPRPSSALSATLGEQRSGQAVTWNRPS